MPSFTPASEWLLKSITIALFTLKQITVQNLVLLSTSIFSTYRTTMGLKTSSDRAKQRICKCTDNIGNKQDDK